METGPWKMCVCVCVIPMGPPPFRIPSQPSNNPRSRGMVSRTWFHAQKSYPRFMPICQIFRDRIFLHTFPSLPFFLSSYFRRNIRKSRVWRRNSNRFEEKLYRRRSILFRLNFVIINLFDVQIIFPINCKSIY